MRHFKKENQRGQGSYLVTLATKTETIMQGEPSLESGKVRHTPYNSTFQSAVTHYSFTPLGTLLISSLQKLGTQRNQETFHNHTEERHELIFFYYPESTLQPPAHKAS